MLRPTTLRRLCALLCVAALSATACGDDDGTEADPGSDTTEAGDTEAPVLETADPERCEANRDAGEIVFATGFDFGSAVSILDVVAAEDQGYYDDLCLDVRVQAGFSVANIGLLSAN